MRVKICNFEIANRLEVEVVKKSITDFNEMSCVVACMRLNRSERKFLYEVRNTELPSVCAIKKFCCLSLFIGLTQILFFLLSGGAEKNYN